MKHSLLLIKAISWRVCGTILTAAIVFFVTHKWSVALFASFIEFFSKVLAFYFHELLWLRIQKLFA